MAMLGFIGTGRLGMPMAAKLASAGHTVRCWDLERNQALPANLMFMSSASEAADGTDAVMLCLPSDEAVQDVMFGPTGLGTAARPPKFVIDHSTIHPVVTVEIANRSKNGFGSSWIDAPVSGGPSAAVRAGLTIWLGGDRAEVETVLPWLNAYAGRVTYMGPQGFGQVAKSCNQLIVTATIAALSDMFGYGQACGIAPMALLNSLQGASADSPVLRAFGALLATNQFPAASKRNMLKDVSIIEDLAKANGLSLPLASLAHLILETL